MDDAPIDRPNNATIVKIGDLRIARGRARRERDRRACKHLDLTYDAQERRIWCDTCEREIEPFDAVLAISEHVNDEVSNITRRKRELEDAEKFAIRRRATKALDEVWRGKMLPCCVQCGDAMFPEEYVKVGLRVGREYALAERKRRAKKATDDPT